MKLLSIPGWTGSDLQHWQTLWELETPIMSRVEQDDWDRPDPEQWSSMLETAIASSDEPTVLVAHSCGVLTVMRWLERPDRSQIKGAFLVAAPDPTPANALDEVRRFGPPKLNRLPFPSILVASRNDVHCDFKQAEKFAAAWGSAFVDGGNAGHFNTVSGYGPWPDGRSRLITFARSLAEQPLS